MKRSFEAGFVERLVIEVQRARYTVLTGMGGAGTPAGATELGRVKRSNEM